MCIECKPTGNRWDASGAGGQEKCRSSVCRRRVLARVFGYLALGDSVAFWYLSRKIYAASRPLDASPNSLVVERCGWLAVAIRLRPRRCLSVACSPTRRVVEQILKLSWLGTLLFPTPANSEAPDYCVCHQPWCRRVIAPIASTAMATTRRRGTRL